MRVDSRRVFNGVAAAVIFVVAPAWFVAAQTPAVKVPPSNMATTEPEASPSPAPATPALTELERALVENVNLLTELRRAQFEADTCRGALAQPRADATAQQVTRTLDDVKRRIERDHPGFTWDATSGTFTPKPDREPRR